jgi:two-component system, NtrC family, response regulator AtoC
VAPVRILIVDDEKLIRWSLRQRLEAAGYEVLEAEDGAEALEKCREDVDLVILDFRLPDTDGLSLIPKIKELSNDVVIILLTAYASVPSAIEAIKLGAYHYVNKPVELEEMVLLVEKALETTRLRREVRALRARESAPYGFDRIVGESAPMQGVKALLRKVAASPSSTVLLTGESGTGKDLAAKAIHFGSARATGPFLNITCSAIPETLLESELFGHEKGAFTDAKGQKKGLLEQAEGGTVFLDEIGEIAPVLQAKLLRFLEEKAFRRVGGSSDVRVDVRVIAATNRNLEEAVRDGRFREDLYYRLRVLPVELPPLRERDGDVLLLASHFVDDFNREFKKAIRGFVPDARAALETYPWPGNVRELRNVLERAVLLADHDLLERKDVLALTAVPLSAGFQLPAGGLDVEQLERDLLAQALKRSGGNQTKAGKLLGLNRDQIRYRIEKFGLAV